MDPGETAKLPPFPVEPIGAPPDGTVYQLIEVPVPLAFKLEVPPGQIDVGEADADVMTGFATVTVTATLGEGEHPLLPHDRIT